MGKNSEELTVGRVSIEKIIKKAVSEAFESWRRMVEKKPDQVNTVIEKAVQEGIKAGYKQAENRPKDAYKATERRLYTLSDLKEKVEAQKEYLADIEEHGLPLHSNDFVRFQRSGSRLTPDEVERAIKQDLTARIAANEYKIKEVLDALTPLTNDLYYLTLSGKYFEEITDEEIAGELHCDPRTVRRNRGRLVNRVAIRLYGADAL